MSADTRRHAMHLLLILWWIYIAKTAVGPHPVSFYTSPFPFPPAGPHLLPLPRYAQSLRLSI